MIALELPKTRKHPGLNVFCPQCNKWINYDNHKSCNHPNKQVYRISVRDPHTKQSRSMVLKTKLYSEAVKETVDFTLALKNKTTIVKKSIEEKPDNLVLAVGLYFRYLKNVDLPEHKKRIRTITYVKDQIRSLNEFLHFLKAKKISLIQTKVHDVNDDIVGMYYKHLLSRQISPFTFNNELKAARTFFNFLIKYKKYGITNPFSGIKFKSCVGSNEIIELDELNRLFDVIHKDNGVQEYSTKAKRNHYYPWLKSAIMIALYTGRRVEEITHLKFKDIDLESLTIKGEDFKSNKLKQIEDDNKKKYYHAPIYSGFMDYLKEIGLEQYKNADRYLIAPECTERKLLSQRMSKAFTHYWKLTGINKKLTFYNLRKTYITKVDIFTDGNAKSITLHSCDRIVNTHYKNNKKVSEEFAKGSFCLF